MARKNPTYYIAPSNISIIPNCNGTPNDLAVSITRGTRIKVYYPYINDLDTKDAQFQEWTLSGRNRRILYADKPYTIYARLNKLLNNNAYLVFAPKVQDAATGEWKDPYVLSPNTSSTATAAITP